MSDIVVPPARAFGPLSLTDFVRYQGASGDMNPLHHDADFARAAGFPSPISAGMYQAGLLATWVTDWLGSKNIRNYRSRFKEIVLPGDVLICHGEVVREYEEQSEARVDVELTCVRAGGGVAILAWATFVR